MKLVSANNDGSTLPNRYNRLKVNLMHMKEGDVCEKSTFLHPAYLQPQLS